MKTAIALLLAACAIFVAGCCTTAPHAKGLKQTYSSFDLPSEHLPKDLHPTPIVNFRGVDLDMVVKVYQSFSGRTVIRGILPHATVTIQNQTPLTQIEVLQMFDTVLAQNGIAMVYSGDKFVKAVPVSQAISENPPEITLPWKLLPESSSVMTRTVRLKHLKPSDAIPMLMPFSKLSGSIIAIDSKNTLILRDYSSSIRRQLELLEKLDQK